MALAFKARVLLELGAELISSDAVALYELIKNGVDAGSETVTIAIDVVIQPSSLRAVLETLAEMGDANWDKDYFLSLVTDHLEPSAPEDQRNAFIATLGRPVDRRKAIDLLHQAAFEFNTLRVVDTGVGMDDDDLQSCYLTVGTPARLKERNKLVAEVAAKNNKEDDLHKRLPLGEKGIGRLAAMRIGHHVHVLSRSPKKKGDTFELALDWRPVFADYDLDASALKFQPKRVLTKTKGWRQGTTITVRALQSDWTVDKLMDLANSDLGKLADPFDQNFANQFLSIRFQGERRELITAFQESNLKYADAECTISFHAGPVTAKGRSQNVAGLQVTTEYKRFGKMETLVHSGEHLSVCVSHPPGKGKRPKASDRLAQSDEVVAALSTLGDFEAKFFWFNRGRFIKEHKELWRSTLEKFVRNWSGGFLVYRDGFRVYPYGSGSDDWLDLDRKALASSAYKLNRAQIVGYLRIGSITNPALLDQTNREGFRDCPEKEALRRLLRQAIIADCKTFLEKTDKENKVADDETIRDIDERIQDSNEAAVANLRKLQARVPDEANAIQVVLSQLAEVQDAWSRAKETLKAQEEEVEQYLHLAGVGLMIELLAHELARSTSMALELLQDKKLARDPRRLEMLEAQLKTLNKRVRVIDELSVPGRQRKAIHDVIGLMNLMAEFYQPKLERHSVTFRIAVKPNRSMTRRLEKGQFLQIIDNLLSNSMYWLINRLDRSQSPKISAEIDTNAGLISFSDNGPGIPESIGAKVFDPFYTSKPAGSGRGLGLYIAKRLAEENGISLELLPPEGGRHPGFLLRLSQK